MTTTIDATTLEGNLDEMVYMRDSDGPACDAMKALYEQEELQEHMLADYIAGIGYQ